MAKREEMTLADVLTDPFILALAKADGWSRHAFTEEMHAASDALRSRDLDRARVPFSTRRLTQARSAALGRINSSLKSLSRSTVPRHSLS